MEPRWCLHGASMETHGRELIGGGDQFAPNGASLGRMNKVRANRILTAMQAYADVGRGDVYRWLKKNKRRVRAAFESTGAGWDGVVAALAEDKILGRDGKAPNRKSVPRVWARVCADEAAAAAKSSADVVAERHRSRQRGDWQPPVAQAERPASPRAPPPAPFQPPPPPGSSPSGPYDHLPERVRAQLIAVDEQFAYLDRHIIRPKQRS
jgi:phytoene dehydrogenase-like protein